MRKFLYIALIGLLLILIGCGDTVGQDVETGGTILTITDSAGRQVNFAEYPTKIVALSNGETDIVYALGDELVGRPSSALPLTNEKAEQVTQIGTVHEVDLEKIALLRPDVVLGHNPMNEKDIPTLEGIGTKVILTSANSITEIQQQIGLIGELLDKKDKAGELIAGINAELARYSSEFKAKNKPRTLLVYGAPGTFMAALPTSLAGDILESAGGVNIASDYPRLQSYPQYAQMNAERIVEANPQYIFIMTHGEPEAVEKSFLQEMATNSAWNSVDAVKFNRVKVLTADLFGSNPGTRVMEALEIMHDALSDINMEENDE